MTDNLTIEDLKSKLEIIVKWLELNQPDVFRRGIWDALSNQTKESVPVGAEDLKCCGNCWHRERTEEQLDVIEWCEIREDMVESCMVCTGWEYDGVQNRGLE
jgi:hypothetical protein